MNYTYTGFPRHDESQYQVKEHDESTAPADLWPLITEWQIRQHQASAQTSLSRYR